jgi:hypothetical protein
MRAAAATVQSAASALLAQLNVLIHENIIKNASKRIAMPDFGPKRISTLVLSAVAERGRLK